VGGYAGQLSARACGIFGVGAYGLALFAELGISGLDLCLSAALVATAFAAIIGTIAFRLRGPYFTLATMLLPKFALGPLPNLNVTRSPLA